MSLRRPRWFRALIGAGRAFVEVVRAELEALQHELSQSSRQLLKVLVLMGIAVVLVGWVLGLLATALIVYLQSTGALTLWQATLLVAGLLAVVAVLLALWSRKIVRQIRPPSQMIRQRLGNHFEWIEGQVRGPGGAESAGGED